MSQFVRQVETEPFGRLGRVQEDDRATVMPERESIYGLESAIDGKDPGTFCFQEGNHVTNRRGSKPPEAAECFSSYVRAGLNLCPSEFLDLGDAWDGKLIGPIHPF